MAAIAIILIRVAVAFLAAVLGVVCLLAGPYQAMNAAFVLNFGTAAMIAVLELAGAGLCWAAWRLGRSTLRT